MRRTVRLCGKTARLTEYFRCLRIMLQNGIMRVSSEDLSKRLGIAPSQVRLDLAEFSLCGRKGYGYGVKELYREISKTLGAGDGMTAYIVGESGLTEEIRASALGRGISLTGECSADDIPCPFPADIAIITDESNPQLSADTAVSNGAKGIWNITQTSIVSDVPTANIPLGDILMMLSYEIKEKERTEVEK